MLKKNIMNAAEMKIRIAEKLEQLSDDDLNFVYNLLSRLDNNSESRKDIRAIFDAAVKQYGAVLQKLAQ